MDYPSEVPELDPAADPCQRVTDYVAGMTDRYCIARFRELSIPEEARF
jgi:dGTP triphosphohydrolase